MPENGLSDFIGYEPALADAPKDIQSLNHVAAQDGAHTDDYLVFLKTNLLVPSSVSKQQIIGPCNQDVPVPECSNELVPICKMDLCRTDVCDEIEPCPTEFCKIDICDEVQPTCYFEDCRLERV